MNCIFHRPSFVMGNSFCSVRDDHCHCSVHNGVGSRTSVDQKINQASLSAQLIVPSRPWRMTRIQTWISHVHPTASIHQRGTLLRLCYCGVLRAGAPPAMLWRTRVLVTRSEATVELWMGAARTTRDRGSVGWRRTGPNRRRAGARGPGVDPGRRCLSGMLAEHSLIG